jgi:DNA-directed RNA polymerase subunit RPC12/RpoP
VWWIKLFGRIFIGRNGPDHLSLGLSILALALSLVPVTIFFYISLAVFAIAIFRMFSRNIERRRKENLMFLRLVNKPKMWYYNLKAARAQSKLYKIFKCPDCGQKLRVPKGKGKVSIKCSKCGSRIVRNT